MESVGLLDRAGRRRSQATLSDFHQGRVPRNKGLRYPPDPPTVEEIIAVMRAAGDGPEAMRLRGLIIVLWRAGLRISVALALAETDLDRQRSAVLVRAGKGGRRREVGMDRWAWEQLDPWLELRRTLPVGALFCVLRGPTRGRPYSPAGIRAQLHRSALAAGVRGSVRTAPTPARPCCRDVPRGDPAPGHTASTRACRPRDHLRVPARNRQHRDHPRGP
jgi:integrase